MTGLRIQIKWIIIALVAFFLVLFVESYSRTVICADLNKRLDRMQWNEDDFRNSLNQDITIMNIEVKRHEEWLETFRR